MRGQEWIAAGFEEHRAHLGAVAFRMLGSICGSGAGCWPASSTLRRMIAVTSSGRRSEAYRTPAGGLRRSRRSAALIAASTWGTRSGFSDARISSGTRAHHPCPATWAVITFIRFQALIEAIATASAASSVSS